MVKCKYDDPFRFRCGPVKIVALSRPSRKLVDATVYLLFYCCVSGALLGRQDSIRRRVRNAPHRLSCAEGRVAVVLHHTRRACASHPRCTVDLSRRALLYPYAIVVAVVLCAVSLDTAADVVRIKNGRAYETVIICQNGRRTRKRWLGIYMSFSRMTLMHNIVWYPAAPTRVGHGKIYVFLCATLRVQYIYMNRSETRASDSIIYKYITIFFFAFAFLPNIWGRSPLS